ncbi:DUF3073 domain-containing protein [Alloscardovia theropitheci]|uniref:DUF3073 domain-containing protein n=1 Tax=Alloscardovia theropitheci TaxID=2496842 RepID=A0A4R0R031_9BIFI|nr:DUF3073 domain-containing protein [Alloscardovia theropitheci]TCD54336.1 DUF3073 domain-containing protein [Alloscardovia theropitheci]
MGRGRQKAKQTKIARKLKYLTTDTDYDELAKELNNHSDDVIDDADLEIVSDESVETIESETSESSVADNSQSDDDLDDYAAWAAQAAKKAEATPARKAVPHKPFPKMPVPGIKPKPKAE